MTKINKEMEEYLVNLESDLFNTMLMYEDELGRDAVTFKRAESKWSIVYGICKEFGIKTR